MPCLALLLALSIALPASAQTALETLQAGPRPLFKEGHSLLPLSTWGPEFDFEVRRELCEHWGYCLQFGRLRPELVRQLDDPQSTVSRVCALCASDPVKYPLHVITAPAFSIRSFIDELPPDTWCRDAEGNLIDGKQTWSPEAPDSAFEMIADYEADMLAEVLKRAPIAVLTNGGEYGLSVEGHHEKVWERDPKVVAARGEQSWYEYISRQKARQEMIVTRRLQALVPDRKLYIYYFTDGSAHRMRYSGWKRWEWDYRDMQPVSDMPNSSVYYRHYNDGWSGKYDMLTMALNCVGGHRALGEDLSYNWLSPGWPGEGRPDPPVSDAEHYTGYLKCNYTAGMIGGVAGYFAYDPVESWVWQLMSLGRVHAVFSHLDDFLRQSDLLPGPSMHAWSTDQPAYEFPTGEADCRVLCRKHRERDEWLLCAWAAAGEDREVQVEIPELGRVTLQATAVGRLYRGRLAEGGAVVESVDQDAGAPGRQPR